MTQESSRGVHANAGASSRWIEPAGKLRYFALAALCIAIDLASKRWAFEVVEMVQRRGDPWPKHVVIPGVFDLVRMENPGAVGGLGGDYPWLLVSLRLAAVAALAFGLLRVARVRWFLLTALALVLGGAIGNLYDNLAFAEDRAPGKVRDFLSFDLSGIGIREFPGLVHGGHFNAFNFADACIVCGAIALVLLSFAPAPRSLPEAAQKGT
ncbi:MAG: signal peptidase II [Planctomycetes bacterium]|nr:signal peptidase II [Planctomycetota bacterium]